MPERSTAVAMVRPEVVPPEERLAEGAFDARVALFSARELAMPACLGAGATWKGENQERGCSRTAAKGHGVLGNGGIQVGFAKADQQSVAPAASQKVISLGPKSSPVELDPLSLEPSAGVGHKVTGRCRRLNLVHTIGSSIGELPPEFRCSDNLIQSGAISPQLQRQQGGGAGLAEGEYREMSALSSHLSLSRRLDVTHIDTAVDIGSEEGLPSTPASEFEGMLAVTVLEASQCGTDGDCSEGNTDHTGKEHELVGIIDQCISSPASIDRGDRGAMADLNLADIAHSRSSWVVAAQQQRLPVEHGQSPSEISSLRIQVAQLDSDSDTHDKPMIPTPLRQSKHVGRDLRPPPQRSARVTEEVVDESESGAGSSESPEVVRRSSLRSRELDVSRGSWETDGGDQGQLRAEGIRDRNVHLSLSQSSIGSAGDRTFGPALSPAIDGFGMDVGDVLSPLALAGSRYAEGDGFDGGGWESPCDAAGSFPARSPRSESKVGFQWATPVRDRGPPCVEEESLDQSTQTPSMPQCSFTSPCGVETGASGAEELMPPPPPQLPLGYKQSDQQFQRQQRSPRQTATPGRSQSVEKRSWRHHSKNTSAERYGRMAEGTESLPRDELFDDSPMANGGGTERYYEQASIGSFSESEINHSSVSNCSAERRAQTEVEADISLVEATPRKRSVRPGADLAGFYAPLLVRSVLIGV